MEVHVAGAEHVGTYADFGRAAQAWLRSRGLGQYVPAAHDEYAEAILARAEAGMLYGVRDGGEAVAFFSLDAAPTPWWPADGEAALYLAGVVVSRRARGRGVGGHIIRWSAAEAARRGLGAVRVDCHAGNPWLCRYYEAHGFVPRGRFESHPGYHIRLYQLATEG
jgi:GNAT superfamily N-acetyltransferase